jgi:hypothetical protein
MTLRQIIGGAIQYHQSALQLWGHRLNLRWARHPKTIIIGSFDVDIVHFI